MAACLGKRRAREPSAAPAVMGLCGCGPSEMAFEGAPPGRPRPVPAPKGSSQPDQIHHEWPTPPPSPPCTPPTTPPHFPRPPILPPPLLLLTRLHHRSLLDNSGTASPTAANTAIQGFHGPCTATCGSFSHMMLGYGDGVSPRERHVASFITCA